MRQRIAIALLCLMALASCGPGHEERVLAVANGTDLDTRITIDLRGAPSVTFVLAPQQVREVTVETRQAPIRVRHYASVHGGVPLSEREYTWRELVEVDFNLRIGPS